MRKPDPVSDAIKPRSSISNATRRRKSTPAVNAVPTSDEDGDADVEGPSRSSSSGGRRKTLHDASVSRLPTAVARVNIPAAEPSGAWGDEARRHSMAV